jgi:hypothetical protein
LGVITYAKLKDRPRVLRSLTGLTAEAFKQLAQRFGPQWQAAEHRRLSRPGRVRAIGGGHPYTLGNTDKLLMFLALARHGLTYELAGFLFGLDTSNARKLFLRLAPVVEAAADPQLASFLKEAQRKRQDRHGGTVGSWEQFLQLCPELAEVAVDSTEQPLCRPGRKRARKQYYSGKHKRHTLKTQIVVSQRGRVLHVSGDYPGPTPENTLYDQEKLGRRIPPRTRQFVDRGFRGLKKRHPQHDLRIPHQRPSPGCKGRQQKGKPLTRGQKQANTLRSKRRVVVEHRLAAIKGYRLLAETWRSRVPRHNPVFRAIAAVTNFRLAA